MVWIFFPSSRDASVSRRKGTKIVITVSEVLFSIVALLLRPDNWHTIYLLCRGCCFSPRPLEVQFLLSGQRLVEPDTLVSFVHIMSRHTNLENNLFNIFHVTIL